MAMAMGTSMDAYEMAFEGERELALATLRELMGRYPVEADLAEPSGDRPVVWEFGPETTAWYREYETVCARLDEIDSERCDRARSKGDAGHQCHLCH